jgi:hypothetical protein
MWHSFLFFLQKWRNKTTQALYIQWFACPAKGRDKPGTRRDNLGLFSLRGGLVPYTGTAYLETKPIYSSYEYQLPDEYALRVRSFYRSRKHVFSAYAVFDV